MVSFPHVSPPKPHTHLSSPPHVLHALPISLQLYWGMQVIIIIIIIYNLKFGVAEANNENVSWASQYFGRYSTCFKRVCWNKMYISPCSAGMYTCSPKGVSLCRTALITVVKRLHFPIGNLRHVTCRTLFRTRVNTCADLQSRSKFVFPYVLHHNTVYLIPACMNLRVFLQLFQGRYALYVKTVWLNMRIHFHKAFIHLAFLWYPQSRSGIQST